MRIINIDLSQDTRCPQKVFGGNAREHNESKLVVKLPERMLRDDISYYYFEFQTVLGEHIVSPNIYKNELSDGNKISVTLWEQLLPFAGDLNFCVNAVDLAEDNTITIKGKTSICALQILKSPTGDDALIDVNSTKDELQEVIDKALQDAKDSGDFKGDPGDVNTLQMNTVCANALRGAASGSSVRLSDISPNEHTLGVKVSSKNLIPYPYVKDRTQPVAGITWTVNSDGSITANGTATGNSTCWLTRKSLIPGQTYTISTGLSTPVPGCTLVANYFPTGSSNYKAWLNVQTTKTGAFPSDGDRLACYCSIASGTTVENLVFKPQIELGSTATAYTPYISDLSTVNVTRCGKNILEYPYVETTLTRNGLTFTDNKDGTITVNGTATADTQFRLQDTVVYPNNSNPFNSLIGKKVYINGSPEGSSKDTYAIQWISAGVYGNGVMTVTKSSYYRFAIFVKSGITVENLVFKPQIELGITAIPYEPYQGQSYTPATDGTVSGVKSLYPTTTLMTDTEGAIIEAEYSKDINKAFAELQQAIISLGGNV